MILSHQHFDLLDTPIINRFAFKPPFQVPVKMENEACFILPIKAQGQIFHPSGKEIVNEQDGLLMKCGYYINRWDTVDKSEVSQILIIRFVPSVIKFIFDDIFPDYFQKAEKPAKQFTQKIVLDELFKKYVDSLLFYFDYPDLVNPELIKLKVKELILLLLNVQASEEVLNLFKSLFDTQTYSLKKIVDNHIFDNLSIAELASLCNMSESHFKKKFKQNFEISPGQYIISQRLKKAENLLKFTSESITEIAYECGFSDLGYFSKIFRKNFGIAPSEFRLSK